MGLSCVVDILLAGLKPPLSRTLHFEGAFIYTGFATNVFLALDVLEQLNLDRLGCMPCLFKSSSLQ